MRKNICVCITVAIAALSICGCNKQKEEEVNLAEQYEWMNPESNSDDVNSVDKQGDEKVLTEINIRNTVNDEKPVKGTIEVNDVQVELENVNVDNMDNFRTIHFHEEGIDYDNGNILNNEYTFIKVMVTIVPEKDCVGTFSGFEVWTKKDNEMLGGAECCYHNGEMASNDLKSSMNVNMYAGKENTFILGFALVRERVPDWDELYLVPSFGDIEGETVHRILIQKNK